jgi:hypothetical protein
MSTTINLVKPLISIIVIFLIPTTLYRFTALVMKRLDIIGTTQQSKQWVPSEMVMVYFAIPDCMDDSSNNIT